MDWPFLKKQKTLPKQEHHFQESQQENRGAKRQADHSIAAAFGDLKKLRKTSATTQSSLDIVNQNTASVHSTGPSTEMDFPETVSPNAVSFETTPELEEPVEDIIQFITPEQAVTQSPTPEYNSEQEEPGLALAESGDLYDTALLFDNHNQHNENQYIEEDDDNCLPIFDLSDRPVLIPEENGVLSPGHCSTVAEKELLGNSSEGLSLFPEQTAPLMLFEEDCQTEPSETNEHWDYGWHDPLAAAAEPHFQSPKNDSDLYQADGFNSLEAESWPPDNLFDTSFDTPTDLEPLTQTASLFQEAELTPAEQPFAALPDTEENDHIEIQSSQRESKQDSQTLLTQALLDDTQYDWDEFTAILNQSNNLKQGNEGVTCDKPQDTQLSPVSQPVFQSEPEIPIFDLAPTEELHYVHLDESPDTQAQLPIFQASEQTQPEDWEEFSLVTPNTSEVFVPALSIPALKESAESVPEHHAETHTIPRMEPSAIDVGSVTDMAVEFVHLPEKMSRKAFLNSVLPHPTETYPNQFSKYRRTTPQTYSENTKELFREAQRLHNNLNHLVNQYFNPSGSHSNTHAKQPD